MTTIARPRGKTPVSGKPRKQLNISFQLDSSLPKRLDEAARITGQSETQIAREVLDNFLEAWVQAETTKLSVLREARSRITEAATILPGVRMSPRHTGSNRPAPGYADVVAARRPVPPRSVGDATPAEPLTARKVGPRTRPVAVAVVDDDE